MHKSDILGSNTNNIYNSDRVPLIHLDQLPKILICKFNKKNLFFFSKDVLQRSNHVHYKNKSLYIFK